MTAIRNLLLAINVHQQGVTQNGNTIDYYVANKPCIPTSVAAGMQR